MLDNGGSGNRQRRDALDRGSGEGIGRAAALAFAGRGVAVVIADVDDAAGKQTVALVNERGGEGLFVHTDVAQARDVEQLLARTVDAFGALPPCV